VSTRRRPRLRICRSVLSGNSRARRDGSGPVVWNLVVSSTPRDLMRSPRRGVLPGNLVGAQFVRPLLWSRKKAGSGKSTLAVGLEVAAMEERAERSHCRRTQGRYRNGKAARKSYPAPIGVATPRNSSGRYCARSWGIWLAISDYRRHEQRRWSLRAIAKAIFALIQATSKRPTAKLPIRRSSPFARITAIALVLNPTPQRGLRWGVKMLHVDQLRRRLLALPYVRTAQ